MRSVHAIWVPDAPTLCAGWSTADLAAHLVARERRPDSGPGLVWPPLAGHTDKVRRTLRDRTPWPELISTVRRGPPLLLRPVDGPMNTIEFFIHIEDVRRAQPAWEPRPLSLELADALWSRLGAGGMAKKVAATVEITSPGYGSKQSGSGPRVELAGDPGELTLFCRRAPRGGQGRDGRRLPARGPAALGPPRHLVPETVPSGCGAAAHDRGVTRPGLDCDGIRRKWADRNPEFAGNDDGCVGVADREHVVLRADVGDGRHSPSPFPPLRARASHSPGDHRHTPLETFVHDPVAGAAKKKAVGPTGGSGFLRRCRRCPGWCRRCRRCPGWRRRSRWARCG